MYYIYIISQNIVLSDYNFVIFIFYYKKYKKTLEKFISMS